MKKLIYFAVHHPKATLMMAAAVCVFGVISALKLPLDAVPDITNNQVSVSAQVEGLSPVQIEQQVTFPIETELSAVPFVRSIRSITRPRLSQVTLIFDDDADLYTSRQLVSERLQALSGELPEGVVPTLGPIATGFGEVYFYTLKAKQIPKDADERETNRLLREIQEWDVKPRLLTVSGVAEVNTSGGFNRQAVVQPNIPAMARRGIRLNDLVEALKRANRYTGGGIVAQGGEQFSVTAVGALSDLNAIENVPVKADQSLSSVRVGDIATVAWGDEPRSGASTVSGKEGMVITVMMLAGGNSRVVAQNIHAKILEIKADMPDWVELETLYSRTDLVDATLNTVGHNLFTGAALVVLILILLLGNIRAAIITAVTIPVSMLIAVIFMNRFGISGNLMSLGAIDFGILVDGAVIVLDHCVRMVSEHRVKSKKALTREELKDIIYNATVEVRQAAGYGQLIIIVALLPLFGLTGIEAKTFTPMAATLALALGAAFFVSFLVVPALATMTLSLDTKDSEPWLMRKVNQYYPGLMETFLRWPKQLAGIGIGLVIVAVLLFTRLGAVFMPQLDEGAIALQIIRPTTISLRDSIKLQELSEQLVGEFEEVRITFARTGTAEIATDPMGVNISDTYAILNDEDQWPDRIDGRPWTKDELIQAIGAKMSEEIPGQRILVSQPIQLRFNELLEGTRADIAVKVFGTDLEEISGVAAKVAEVIKTVEGAGDVELEVRGTTPILEVRPDYELMSAMGINAGEVLESVETALAGTDTGTIYMPRSRRFPLLVRMSEVDRSDLDMLRNIPVAIGEAETRPLGKLAKIKFKDSFTSISREQTKRRAAILVNPRGRDTESFVFEAKDKVEKSVKLPDGVYIEWGGSFENLQKAKTRLSFLTPVALVLIFIMILAAFGDSKLALLVFAGVPLSLIGGVLGLLARGIPFSISAGVGFIALAGISVLNGVVLVSTSLRYKEQGMDAIKSIKEAARSRVRPVLMTAMVEVFGFLPMMFAGGRGAEVQQPLATVVVCGVISATVLTLLMLPAWQVWLEKRREA